MKIRLSKGEWWPVYSIREYDGVLANNVVEVSEEKFKAWMSLFDRFEKLQLKLSAIYDSQHSKKEKE